MLEIKDPMSYNDLEKILKHLPEPSEVDITLCNFDHSNVLKQTSELYPELNLKHLDYQGLDGRLEDSSKEKILKIYRALKNRGESGKEVRFIGFKKARWRLDNMKIELSQFEIKIRCTKEVPDYINEMKEELKGTFIDYKIIQTPNLY